MKKQDQLEIKVLVIDSKRDKNGQEVLRKFAKNMGDSKGIKLPVYFENGPSIPKGYDVYVLHLSDIPEGAVDDLKKQCPWAKVISIGRHQSRRNYAFIDDCWDILDMDYLEFLIEDIKKEYSQAASSEASGREI